MMTDPHVSAMLRYSDELHDRYLKLRATIDTVSLNRQRRPDVWSVGQCLHHIITSERTYLPQLQKIITHREPSAASDYVFRPTRFGKWFARQVGPEGRRMKAPSIFRPEIHDFDIALWDAYDKHEQTVRRLMTEANGLDLNRIRVVSPVTRLFRFNLGDCFIILLGHRDRHLRQAGKLVNDSKSYISHG